MEFQNISFNFQHGGTERTEEHRGWCVGICLLALLVSATSLVAQNSAQPISLETVLTLGGANNLTIQEFRQRQELAAADLAKAREWWLPDLSAGAATHQLQGAAMNSNGLYFLDVNRNSLWAGAQLDLRWDFGEGIFKTNAAKRRADAAQYFTKAERNRALLESINAYFDFQTAQLSWQAWQQLAAQADTIALQVGALVEAGIRYQSEGLLAKSNANHLKVEALNSRAAFGKKSAALVRLLDPGTPLVSVDTLLVPLELANGEFAVASFEAAHQRRPEMLGMKLNLEALQAEKKTTTAGLLLPELRASAYASRFGGLFENVPPADPLLYPNPDVLYPTSALGVSLMWRIPIGRLVYGGELKQYNARLGIQQTQIEQQQAQINEEIIAARAQLLAAKEQMALANEGSELAGLALRQSIQRQELGTVLPFEILQTQEVFIKSRLDFLEAVASYNKAQYGLWVAMGNDL